MYNTVTDAAVRKGTSNLVPLPQFPQFNNENTGEINYVFRGLLIIARIRKVLTHSEH